MVDIEQAWVELGRNVEIPPDIQDLLRERFSAGFAEYGNSGLIPGNGRDLKREAMEEGADFLNYLAMILAREEAPREYIELAAEDVVAALQWVKAFSVPGEATEP